MIPQGKFYHVFVRIRNNKNIVVKRAKNQYEDKSNDDSLLE